MIFSFNPIKIKTVPFSDMPLGTFFTRPNAAFKLLYMKILPTKPHGTNTVVIRDTRELNAEPPGFSFVTEDNADCHPVKSVHIEE